MGLGDKPSVEKSERCGICERNPAFLCPTCPRRRPGERDTFDHGWARAREADPEMAEIDYQDARISRSISITHESHPAYPELMRLYQKNGERRAALFQRRMAKRSAT